MSDSITPENPTLKVVPTTPEQRSKATSMTPEQRSEAKDRIRQFFGPPSDIRTQRLRRVISSAAQGPKKPA